MSAIEYKVTSQQAPSGRQQVEVLAFDGAGPAAAHLVQIFAHLTDLDCTFVAAEVL